MPRGDDDGVAVGVVPDVDALGRAEREAELVGGRSRGQARGGDRTAKPHVRCGVSAGSRHARAKLPAPIDADADRAASSRARRAATTPRTRRGADAAATASG